MSTEAVIRVRRIAIFVGSLRGGGAEKVAAGLAAHFESVGCEVTVITLHGAEDDFYELPETVSRRCVEPKRLETKVGRFFGIWNRIVSLRRVITELASEIVVGISTIQNVTAIMACAGLPTKVVISERTNLGDDLNKGLWSFLRKFTYRWADGNVAQTEGAANWLRKRCGVTRVRVIPNAVAWPFANRPPNVLCEEIVSDESKVILGVGSLYEIKGHDLLIDAFATLSHAYPGWIVVISGGDQRAHAGWRKSLEEKVERLGLTQRVKLTGLVGNVGEWYGRADLFVLSSRREGFPNALLEAMASGCACVSFDCETGPGDIIVDGENGLLVESENTVALAQAMEILMRDPALRQKLGENAKKVRERFSQASIMSQWQDYMEEVTVGARCDL